MCQTLPFTIIVTTFTLVRLTEETFPMVTFIPVMFTAMKCTIITLKIVVSSML